MKPPSGSSGLERRPAALLWPYLGAALASLLILFWLLDIRRADWHVPFIYAGDALFYLMLFKSMIDNGWYLHNDFLGMPWPVDLHDFPLADNLHFLLIKLGTLLAPDPALVLNAYFVATFPLTAVTSLYVFRRFNISFLPALLGSLLYTFIPFHLQRGEVHLFLSAYYVVPLVVLVSLWACERSDGAEGAGGLTWRSLLRDRRLGFSVVVCLLIGSSGGVYYSLFGCYFLLIAGLLLAVREGHIRHALLPSLLAAVILATLVVNVSPTIVYRFRHGATDAAARTPAEAEVYGLKITQLVLPVTGHRVAALRELKDAYNGNPLVNENDDSSLGLIGSVGFLTLLGWVFVRVARASKASVFPHPVLNHLSILNLAAVLLGTIGGFGALVALLVSPSIRAYNRISVYIAFFSLFAVVLALDCLLRSSRLTRRSRMVVAGLIVVLIGLGVLDQTSTRFKPDYVRTRSEYRSDADFVSRIEAAVPPGAMIFQLPFRHFPESPPTARLVDYDLFRSYAHSKQLRWSYGAVRGRASEAWQESVVGKPLGEFLETVALAGFKGITIDRFGYTDGAAKLEADLAAILKEKAVVSADARLAFFDVRAFEARLSTTFTADHLAAKRQDARYPLLVKWGRGCFVQEGTADDYWRWCERTGRLQLYNPQPRARRVTITGSFAAADDSNLQLDSRLLVDRVKIGPRPQSFSWSLVVPPGWHTIRFSSDGPRVHAPLDQRTLVFRVINFTHRPES